MAPRWFVSRFVSGCHRSAGCRLWAMGHWPLTTGREKVAGIPSFAFRMSLPKVYPLVFLGCVWYNYDLC